MLRKNSLYALVLVASLPSACGKSNGGSDPAPVGPVSTDANVATTDKKDADVAKSNNDASADNSTTDKSVLVADKKNTAAVTDKAAADTAAAEKAAAEKATADKAAADKAAADKAAADKAAADKAAADLEVQLYTSGMIPTTGCFEMLTTAAMAASVSSESSGIKMTPGTCPTTALVAGETASPLGTCAIANLKQYVYSRNARGSVTVESAKTTCEAHYEGAPSGVWSNR
jgi:hypothetical protein